MEAINKIVRDLVTRDSSIVRLRRCAEGSRVDVHVGNGLLLSHLLGREVLDILTGDKHWDLLRALSYRLSGVHLLRGLLG